MKENMKKYGKNFINFIVQNRCTLYLAIPFILMDLISFFPAYYPIPNIFTIVWIILFIGVIRCLKGVAGKIAYWIIFLIFFALFLTNMIYYSLTSFYFSFNLLLMADEGSSYILDTILQTNPVVYIIALAVLVIAIIVYKKCHHRRHLNLRN